MAHILTGKQATQAILDSWNNSLNSAQEYAFHEHKPNSIQLNAGAEEMIRISADGFYVRGVRVPADDKEAETVYEAFKQWLAWSNLQRK